MIIRNNGPLDINKFDSMSYAKFWVDKGKSLVKDKLDLKRRKKDIFDNKGNRLYILMRAISFEYKSIFLNYQECTDFFKCIFD